MWFNILIVTVVGLLSYSLTLYFDHSAAPLAITEVPVNTIVELDKTADTIPDFSFTTIDGQTLSASDFRGKIIILNFWATWCAPCIKEFPSLLELAANYAQDVVFIALSSDLKEEDMLRFLNKMQKDGQIIDAKNILIALDENNNITRDLFQTYKLPETIIIDREGRMLRKLVGANWDALDLSQFISKL